MEYFVFDYETYSEAPLKKTGAFEYSIHPSTEILCVAWKFGRLTELRDAPVKYWSPHLDGGDFQEFLAALRDPKVMLVAQNALFEQVITANVFGPRYMASKPELRTIPLQRWICTASMARAVGLPGNLEGTAEALKLSHQKDMQGHRLMLKMSQPRRPSKLDSSTRHLKPEDLERLLDYCKTDVEAETEIFLKVPELPDIERKFWLLNQKMNLDGFAVDRELATNALNMIAVETKRLDERVSFITGGKIHSARQREKVLNYLNEEGMDLPNLQGKTIQDYMKTEEFQGHSSYYAQEMVRIRNDISRSSTAKYSAFEIRSRHDGRARDNTIYFKAHTGREAGTGLQPHNLFKTIFKQADVEVGLDLIKRNDFDTLSAIFDRPMELFASCLRSCIVAEKGNLLDVGDFATIEVRVLFWLAGEVNGLEALKNGKDLYCQMAGKIYGLNADKIKANYKAGSKIALNRRQLGKQTVLGAGFGIGVNGKKFLKTAKQYGLDITLGVAQRAIRAYRDLYSRVPIFWKNVEKAAFLAMQNPGKKYKVSHVVWEKKGEYLYCHLPIGRPIVYFAPRIMKKKTPWGEAPVLTYMGIDPVSKKFVRTDTWGGKITENLVQGISRDLLMEALVRLDESKVYRPVLAVHDEIVCERNKNVGSQKEFLQIMEQVPKWAAGLPIAVEGFSEPRYRK